MKPRENNYAFVDGQNLYLAIKELGWKLDYQRFRVYLKEKYSVTTAYMFTGFLLTNQSLYKSLQMAGFVLIFKPILEVEGEVIKGNCDAEMVLQAMIDYKRYDKAVIVTGDGDFYCLVKYLAEKGKLRRVLAPSTGNCSSLLRKAAESNIAFVSDLIGKLEYKRKTPHEDKTS